MFYVPERVSSDGVKVTLVRDASVCVVHRIDESSDRTDCDVASGRVRVQC